MSNELIRTAIRRLIPRGVRNAVRRPRATKERITAKLSHMLGHTAFAELAPGCTVKCHPMCVGEFRVFTTQAEQISEMAAFAAAATPGMKMMDIGAHWGALTLAALHFGGPQAKVLAIEASEQAAATYRVNIGLNGVQARVTLVNAACGDRSGRIPMLATGAGASDYFVIPAEKRPDTILVRQVTADDMRQEHNFQPTHVKIDVEGYEEEVLQGTTAILRELRPVLFLELHGDLIRKRKKEPSAVLDLLEAAGYHQWQSVEGVAVGREALAARQWNVRLVATHRPLGARSGSAG